MGTKLETSLAIFEDLRLGKLRVTIGEDGKPMFVLQDVLNILEMDKHRITEVADRLDESEKGYGLIVTPGGKQRMRTVTEGGLYYVICSSDKPKAKAFRLWVTDTVLVSIRKNKSYILGQEDLDPQDREEVSRKAAALSPVKDNPMDLDGLTYIAPDGMVFTSREECVDYCRSIRE